jgi:hypothetical protein
MALKPLPLPYHQWHQEQLIWRGTEADGALGRRSIQSIIQARLEGSAGGFAAPDIIETPQKALEDVISRIGFRAAGRVRMIDAALKTVSSRDQCVLRAAYWIPPQVGLEAWDNLANLVVFSDLAHRKWVQAKVFMSFGEWITRLSQRKVGVLHRDHGRSLPKASKNEVNLVSKISEECCNLLEISLQNYVDAFRLVGVGSLIQRVLRKSGRKYG